MCLNFISTNGEPLQYIICAYKSQNLVLTESQKGVIITTSRAMRLALLEQNPEINPDKDQLNGYDNRYKCACIYM